MHKTAKAQYSELESDRNPYLQRGRDCAKLTIPSLLPDEGANSSTQFRTPHQSVGSRGVTNLASALGLSLLPPNQPFFRFVLEEQALQEVALVPGAKAELDASLASIERSIMQEIEVNGFRVALAEALKLLVVTGNALLHIPKDGTMRVFRLDRYVVERDPMGHLSKVIIKEDVGLHTLPADVREFAEPYAAAHDKKSCELYTVACWEDGKTQVHQEIYDQIIPGSQGTYDEDKAPLLALRFVAEQGSAYGRSHVEEVYGDLNSLEGLSKAIVEGSAAASKVLFMCSPNGTTRPRDIARSSNGQIISGNAADVSVLQMQKFNDFRVALETMNIINERLNYAFLLAETSIRNAERVTAEEVRLVSQAVERSLGGLYSTLSAEFSLPLVRRMMQRMTKAGKLPSIPEKYITPAIVTGTAALGRSTDLGKLDTFVVGLVQALGPAAMEHLNVSEYLRRRAAALALDTTGLVKTEEELAAERQEAMQAQMMQAGVGPAVGGVAGAVGQALQQAAPNTEPQ